MSKAITRTLYTKIFIHYGSSRYDPEAVAPKNCHNKPFGCLWASPLFSKHGWRRWCMLNQFDHTDFSKRFCFRIKAGERVCVIDGVSDLVRLPIVRDGGIESIDFEAMVRGGIAAIYLTERGQYQTHLAPLPHSKGFLSLYGWDCECIVVLKPDSIYQVPIPKNKRLLHD